MSDLHWQPPSDKTTTNFRNRKPFPCVPILKVTHVEVGRTRAVETRAIGRVFTAVSSSPKLSHSHDHVLLSGPL